MSSQRPSGTNSTASVSSPITASLLPSENTSTPITIQSTRRTSIQVGEPASIDLMITRSSKRARISDRSDEPQDDSHLAPLFSIPTVPSVQHFEENEVRTRSASSNDPPLVSSSGAAKRKFKLDNDVETNTAEQNQAPKKPKMTGKNKSTKRKLGPYEAIETDTARGSLTAKKQKLAEGTDKNHGNDSSHQQESEQQTSEDGPSEIKKWIDDILGRMHYDTNNGDEDLIEGHYSVTYVKNMLEKEKALFQELCKAGCRCQHYFPALYCMYGPPVKQAFLAAELSDDDHSKRKKIIDDILGRVHYDVNDGDEDIIEGDYTVEYVTSTIQREKELFLGRCEEGCRCDYYFPRLYLMYGPLSKQAFIAEKLKSAGANENGNSRPPSERQSRQATPEHHAPPSRSSTPGGGRRGRGGGWRGGGKRGGRGGAGRGPGGNRLQEISRENSPAKDSQFAKMTDRKAVLQSAIEIVSPAVTNALAVRAAREQQKLKASRLAHTEVPEFEDVQNGVQEHLKDRSEAIRRERDMKLALAKKQNQQEAEKVEKAFKVSLH